jgi:hypothetical protein
MFGHNITEWWCNTSRYDSLVICKLDFHHLTCSPKLFLKTALEKWKLVFQSIGFSWHRTHHMARDLLARISLVRFEEFFAK